MDLKLVRGKLLELLLTLLTLALLYGLFRLFSRLGFLSLSPQEAEKICAITVYGLAVLFLVRKIGGYWAEAGLYLFGRAVGRNRCGSKPGRVLFWWAALFLRQAARGPKPAFHQPEIFKALGDIYFHGLTVRPDWDKAAACYGIVLDADSGSRSAMIKAREQGKSIDPNAELRALVPECLANMDLMAGADNSFACLCLGLWHYDYFWPRAKVEPERAAEYFRRAILLGEAAARRLYGLTLLDNDFATPVPQPGHCSAVAAVSCRHLGRAEAESPPTFQVRAALSLLEKDFEDGNLGSGLELGARYARGTARLQADWGQAKEYFSPLLAKVIFLAEVPRPGERFALRPGRGSAKFRRILKYIACRLAELYVDLGREAELSPDQRAILNQACFSSGTFEHIRLGPETPDDEELAFHLGKKTGCI